MASNKDFNVNFNFTQLTTELGKLKNLDAQINQSVAHLAQAAYIQAVAIARQKLKGSSNQELFLQNLKFEKNKDGKFDAYLIIVEKDAMWLEEGHDVIDMRKTHLKGRDSVVIPFKHAGAGMQLSNMSGQQHKLYDEIKTALKTNKISMTKPINNASGNPILSSPGRPRPAATINRIDSSKKGATGESVLNRLNVYQHKTKNKLGVDHISKTLLTFRTLSKDGKGKWEIPARDGAKILDDTYNWILTNFERIMNEGLKNIEFTLT